MGVLAFGIPDGAVVGVGEPLFEFGLSIEIGGARQDSAVVREGVGSDFLGDLGKGLDGAVVGEAAREKCATAYVMATSSAACLKQWMICQQRRRPFRHRWRRDNPPSRYPG